MFFFPLQTDAQYLDALFDGSSLNDEVPNETNCEIIKRCSSLGFHDSTEVCSLAQSKTTEETYFPRRPCLSNELSPVRSNMEKHATNVKEHMSCVSVTTSNSNGNEKDISVLRQAHYSSHRTSKEDEQSCTNVSAGKCMDSQTNRYFSVPSHHLKFYTTSAEPIPLYSSTSDSKQDNIEKENPLTLNAMEHLQTSMEISDTWTKSDVSNSQPEKEESTTSETNAKCATRNPDFLTTATQSSSKMVNKQEHGGSDMSYVTSTCSQSHSSRELLSSDTHDTSLIISNTDGKTDNGQIITQNVLKVGEGSNDTTAHYNFLGLSQSSTVSPNPETLICVSSLENASQERKSEVSIRSPQTPADFLVKETTQVEPYQDDSTPFAENEHKIEPICETSFVSISTPVTIKKRVWHFLKKRKLLKMTRLLLTIQEPSENNANSGKFSRDSKKIETKTEIKHLQDRCQKSRKAKHLALFTDYRWRVKSRQMFRHHVSQVFQTSSGPQPNQKGSKEMNRLLGCFEDPLKTEIHCEKHDIMSQSSAKDLQSNTSDTLLKTSAEEAHSTELNDDAAFELSLQSTINSTGLHFCIANAFNKSVKDERSRNPLTARSVNASDSQLEELSETDKNPLCGTNAISLKPPLIQKVDTFTQYCDEDYMTGLNKDLCAVADAGKNRKIAKKYINCKFCRQTFRHISAYTAHQRIHTGAKPYRCELCGKNFAQLFKLRYHRNVHVQSVSRPCSCCGKKFSEKGDLAAHLKTHVKISKQNNEPRLQASEPNALLKDPTHGKGVISDINNKVNNRYVQKNHKHDRDKFISCKTCGKEFWTASQLAVHEKTHWPVKPYACSICGKGFNQIKALKKHSGKHTGETPFSCFHCGCAFSDLPTLRAHQISKLCKQKQDVTEKNCNIEGFLVTYGVDGQINTPVFFKCQICKQLYQTWCQYTLHLQTHTDSPPYLCFACGQSYENNSVVNVHCRECCQVSGEEVACASSFSEILNSDPRKCADLKDNSQSDQRVASKSDSLSSAGLFHKNAQTWNNLQTEFPAPESPKFVNASHLLETVPLLPQSPTPSVMTCANSPEDVEKPTLWRFKCPRCGQRYKRYRTLSLHMQTHPPAFRYTCRHCGHSFERWNKLWLHQRIHRRKGHRYTCSQCDIQFNFFSAYKMHLLNHAEERPYACPLCPQTFACEEGLHVHRCDFHRPTRKFQCEVCARSFSNLRNLLKHSLLHNGTRSHQCLPCNLSFTNSKGLQEHLNTHNHSASLLPSIPSEPLTFLHKCNICKSSFSKGDLLYAHQICHTRGLKSRVRSTQRSESTSVILGGTQSTTRRSLLSTLDLDAIPKESLFKYPHPDKLYVPPRNSSKVKRTPAVNLEPGEDKDIPQEASTDPVSGTGQSSEEYTGTEMMHQTPIQESIQSQSSGEIPAPRMDTVTDNLQGNSSQMIELYETSVFLMGPATTGHAAENTGEIQDETFECADCSEKIDSAIGLYEHYFLHALGNRYV